MSGSSSSSSSGLSWNRCFLCSSPVVVEESAKGNSREGVEERLIGSVKLVMKYLLHDFKLERGLSSRVIAQWSSSETGAGEGGADDGGEFCAKLCSYCGTLVRSVTKLQLELEVIQMRIVSGLETLKKAVISNSRLYGGNDGVKQDFEWLEEKLLEREAAGGDSSRGRMFLDAIHHFQTFVFENDRKTGHIPLVYLEKFTGQKTIMPLALSGSSGLNLETALLTTDTTTDRQQTIKEGPEDYSEPMEMEHAEEEAADSSYHHELIPTSPPLRLPPQAKNMDQEEVPPTRRRPSRKAAQQCSARFKPSKPPPPPKPKRSDAHLLYLHLKREEAPCKNRAGRRCRSPQRTHCRSTKRQRRTFECDECGIKFVLCASASYKPEQHLREHETPFESNYECPDCKLGFKQKQYFQLHLSYHSKLKTRKCEICGEQRVPFAEMKAHLKTHQEQVFDCPHCSMCYATYDNVVAHLRYHTKISVKCELCPDSSDSNQYNYYQRRADLCRHLFECHGKSEYRLDCPLDGCSQAFFDETGLNNHQLVHAGIHKCQVCQRSFQNKGELDSHTRKEHPTQVKLRYWCNDVSSSSSTTPCLEKFLTKRQLDSHKMKKHGKPKFKCDKCPAKEFLTKTGLQAHQWVEHKVKDEKELANLVCTICRRIFNTKTLLRSHQASHIKDKNFTCEICGFSTNTNVNLRRHKEVHKSKRERKFGCPHCPDKFYDGYSLKLHIRRHTGERPFQCDLCGSAFSQSSALKVHKKKHVEGKEFVGRGPRVAAGGIGMKKVVENAPYVGVTTTQATGLVSQAPAAPAWTNFEGPTPTT